MSIIKIAVRTSDEYRISIQNNDQNIKDQMNAYMYTAQNTDDQDIAKPSIPKLPTLSMTLTFDSDLYK